MRGEPSFSSNVVKEIRPGCRNLQKSYGKFV